jgi:hypothetical protein
MRTLITIRKRGLGYIMDIATHGHMARMGAQCGVDPYAAATAAASAMAQYAALSSNPNGGDLMAPPEVMEHVPDAWRRIDPLPLQYCVRCEKKTPTKNDGNALCATCNLVR